jgi:hypothetical protein
MFSAKKKKKPINHGSLSRVAGKQLQKENNDVVWNELAFFKKENKSLKIEKLVSSRILNVIYLRHIFH